MLSDVCVSHAICVFANPLCLDTLITIDSPFCLIPVILIVVSVCTATGAWNWLIDPDTQKVRTELEVILRR